MAHAGMALSCCPSRRINEMSDSCSHSAVGDSLALLHFLLICDASGRRTGLNAENAADPGHRTINGSAIKQITDRECHSLGGKRLGLFAMWIANEGAYLPARFAQCLGYDTALLGGGPEDKEF